MSAEFPRSPETLFEELQQRCVAVGPLALRNGGMVGSCGTKALQIVNVCNFLIDVFVVERNQAHFHLNVVGDHSFPNRRKLDISFCRSPVDVLVAVVAFAYQVKQEHAEHEKSRVVSGRPYIYLQTATATTSNWMQVTSTGTYYAL